MQQYVHILCRTVLKRCETSQRERKTGGEMKASPWKVKDRAVGIEARSRSRTSHTSMRLQETKQSGSRKQVEQIAGDEIGETTC